MTVLVIGPTSVALAANSAPGGALWHAKRSSENIRLALEQEPESRVRLHVQYAARRVSELTALMIDNAEPQVVDAVSDDLERHVRAAAEGVQSFKGSRPETTTLASESARHLSRQVTVLRDLADIRCDDGPAASEQCNELEETVVTSSTAVAAVRAEPAPDIAGPLVAGSTDAGQDTDVDGGLPGAEATSLPVMTPAHQDLIEVAETAHEPVGTDSEPLRLGGQLGSGATPETSAPLASEEAITPASDEAITPALDEPTAPASGGATSPAADEDTTPTSEASTPADEEPTLPADEASTDENVTVEEPTDAPGDGNSAASGEEDQEVADEETPAAGASEPTLTGTPTEPVSPDGDGHLPTQDTTSSTEDDAPATAPTSSADLPGPSGRPHEGSSAPPTEAAEPTPDASEVSTPPEAEPDSESSTPDAATADDPETASPAFGVPPDNVPVGDEVTPTPIPTATETLGTETDAAE